MGGISQGLKVSPSPLSFLLPEMTMAMLRPIDGAQVDVLVEDTSDPLSTVPDFVESEIAGLQRRRSGAWLMSTTSSCSAAHGLSLLITLRRGSVVKTLLFDAGPQDQTLEQNVSRLAIDLGLVEAIVLSHGHCDHGGGGAMLRALQLIRDRNGGRKVPYYCHPDMFRRRAFQMLDGSVLPLEDVPSIEPLTDSGAEVVNTTEPQFLFDGLAYLSGAIPRVTSFERGLPGQRRKTLDGTGWELDELCMDERFLAVNVAGKGMVVFTACTHAGIVNVLKHVKTCFADIPLHAVMGGLHLAGINERIIPETVEAMREFSPAVLAVGHCTGWRAVTALANAFGIERVAPLSVGKRFSF
jgi:7,8-dihydropterin-6-yl-methyl-4-(beta-D-ribofuranosyl)aminobenzene 5'-phosphate synthase